MAAGVKFIDNEKVVEVRKNATDIELNLSSGSVEITTSAVNCAGLVVDTRLAASAGVHTAQGVLTDEYLQTNVSDIFAIGDCAQICGQLHQYIAPIYMTSKALASTLIGKTSKVNLTFYPIEVKIQQSPTRFMIKEKPDEWQTEHTQNGMIARGLRNGKLSGFAVTGDAVEQMNSLVTEMVT